MPRRRVQRQGAAAHRRRQRDGDLRTRHRDPAARHRRAQHQRHRPAGVHGVDRRGGQRRGDHRERAVRLGRLRRVRGAAGRHHFPDRPGGVRPGRDEDRGLRRRPLGRLERLRGVQSAERVRRCRPEPPGRLGQHHRGDRPGRSAADPVRRRHHPGRLGAHAARHVRMHRPGLAPDAMADRAAGHGHRHTPTAGHRHLVASQRPAHPTAPLAVGPRALSGADQDRAAVPAEPRAHPRRRGLGATRLGGDRRGRPSGRLEPDNLLGAACPARPAANNDDIDARRGRQRQSTRQSRATRRSCTPSATETPPRSARSPARP